VGTPPTESGYGEKSKPVGERSSGDNDERGREQSGYHREQPGGLEEREAEKATNIKEESLPLDEDKSNVDPSKKEQHERERTKEQDGRRDNRRAESDRRGLPASEQVGEQKTPAEDTRRDSQSRRWQSQIGSGESRTRPQYDVNKSYTNEEIHEIVSTVTDIVDGKVEITGEVTEEIKTIAERYVPGGVTKQGRGVLDGY